MTKNYIYFRSPIGKALIGKRVGDKTTISAPAGQIELEITKIK